MSKLFTAIAETMAKRKALYITDENGNRVGKLQVGSITDRTPYPYRGYQRAYTLGDVIAFDVKEEPKFEQSLHGTLPGGEKIKYPAELMVHMQRLTKKSDEMVESDTLDALHYSMGSNPCEEIKLREYAKRDIETMKAFEKFINTHTHQHPLGPSSPPIQMPDGGHTHKFPGDDIQSQGRSQRKLPTFQATGKWDVPQEPVKVFVDWRFSRPGTGGGAGGNQPKQKVCECGKEKHGFASHANWCDLHE